MSKFDFIKTAVKDYKVAALTPSSKYVVRRVLKEIKPRHKFIVEYGPGDGVITKKILSVLPADGRLVVVELNGDFINGLRQINDGRLLIIHDDVQNISYRLKNLDIPRIDVVVSGIPFSLIKSDKRKEIIVNTAQALQPQGIFIVYQTSPLILPILKQCFNGSVRWHFEPRNLVPYFIMVAEK